MGQIVFRRYQSFDHDAVWSVFTACTHQLGSTLDAWDALHAAHVGSSSNVRYRWYRNDTPSKITPRPAREMLRNPAGKKLRS